MSRWTGSSVLGRVAGEAGSRCLASRGTLYLPPAAAVPGPLHREATC